MVRLAVFIFFCMLLAACSTEKKPSTSFYYWKTIFQITAEERQSLEENKVDHLYVRYCDVVIRKGKAIPLSPVVFKESPGLIGVVPVIYIRNEVMLKKDLDVTDLADKLINYINQINSRNNIQSTSIQIDCDWTEGSKKNYFAFLTQLKTRYQKSISVTIRLHQVKYREKTGVPPADKGVLMYYNMGHITADASNSIYERNTAQRYLARLTDYPLTLDVALPIFGWGIHIRDNKVVGLLNKMDTDAVNNDAHFEAKAAPFFEVKDNTFKSGDYFQKGDRIKIESVGEMELREMAHDLHEKLKSRPHEIIFYDLDNFNLRHYPHENFFQKISASF
jgi:hypothetical protein